MENRPQALSPSDIYARAITALEEQLVRLDEAGAHKAAAHLDAVIQQLRRDQLALDLASAARQVPAQMTPESTQKPDNLAGLDTAFLDAIGSSKVVLRKVTQVKSR